DSLLASIQGTGVSETRESRQPPPRVRFQRGTGWHAGRLGQVSDERVYIITSAPLRAGERTTLELSAPSVTAQLPAVVLEDAENLSPGTWGFSARVVVEAARRPSDLRVLTWARGRLAGAGSVPRRTEHRIPLAW